MHLPADYENAETRPSGLSAVGEIPWGTHLCQFYRDRADLLDVLVPFFKAGLEANERCLWITSETLGPTDAAAALAQAVPDLPERMRRGQIDIIHRRDWYLRPQGLGTEDVLNGWLAAEAATLAGGYDGLRLSGDTAWLERKAWGRFMEYEAGVHRAFHSQRILALCSYSLGKCSATDIIDVLRNHGFALVPREGRWDTIRSATQALTVIDVDIPEKEAVHPPAIALADAGRHIAQAKLDLAQVVNNIVREATCAAFAPGCAIELRDEDGETLALAALHHADPARRAAFERLLRAEPARIGEGVVGEVAHTGAPVRLATPEEITRRFAGARADGAHPFASAVVVPLLASGKIIGALTAVRDVPNPPFDSDDEQWAQELADRAALSIENALLYERAQHERARAESANSAKDEFLAMLGHELRNPLSPILTAIQLIRLRAGEQFVKERATIERQVHHMVRLVDDLLDVSRIARGKVELERTPVELVEVVANALEMASPLIEERRHRVMASVPAAGLRIEADAERLAQVVANLLINAAKYTPPGGIIRVTAQAQTGRAVLRVRDNGIGIAPDLLPRIFRASRDATAHRAASASA